MTEENLLIFENYYTITAACQVAVFDLWLNIDKLPSFSYNYSMNIEGFALWMYQRGLKKQTIEFYTRNAKRINLGLDELTLDNVNSFLLKLLKENKSSSYINDYVCTIKQYAKWKELTEFKSLKFIKEKPTIKSTLSDSEIEAFLALPPPIVKHMFHGKMHEYYFKPEVYHRWTLFFKILAFSGMRCGEVANLTIEQIDFGRGVFTLTDTKTNTPRNVPIAPALIGDLTEHIKTCNKYIFSGKCGKPPHDSDWGRRFHERLKRLGIKRIKLTPYSFRHSFITRMLDEDVNLFKVQKIVGHRRIDTTAHYTHLTTKDIVTAIKKTLSLVNHFPFMTA
jgi:Site-specific recombinase XerD